MLQTLAITGPIYLVIALGFLAGRVGIFGKPDMRVLGTYVVKFVGSKYGLSRVTSKSAAEAIPAAGQWLPAASVAAECC